MSSRSPSTVSSAVRLIARGSTFSPCHSSVPLRQPVLLEHPLHGLQIELGAEIEHREILVVEILGDLRLVEFAQPKVVVELAMRLDVAIDVHAHERGKLHEARIDLAERAADSGTAPARSGSSRTSRSAWNCASSFTLVGLTRVSIGPAIKVMLRGCAGLPALRHHRDGHQHRDAGLADREHMGALADHLEELDQVLDIFVEAEPAVPSARRRACCASR